MAFIGAPPQELGGVATHLKDCTLFGESGVREIGKEVILEALAALDEQALRRLSRRYPTRQRRAKPFTDW
eukprot:7127054-Lingulodinium_polyedra.AAC.1